jgi:hypothetical protein
MEAYACWEGTVTKSLKRQRATLKAACTAIAASLRCIFTSMCSTACRDTTPRSLARASASSAVKAKVDSNLANAPTAFVFGRIHVYAAAFKPVVELFEIRQFLDTGFNSFL